MHFDDYDSLIYQRKRQSTYRRRYNIDLQTPRRLEIHWLIPKPKQNYFVQCITIYMLVANQLSTESGYDYYYVSVYFYFYISGTTLHMTLISN